MVLSFFPQRQKTNVQLCIVEFATNYAQRDFCLRFLCQKLSTSYSPRPGYA